MNTEVSLQQKYDVLYEASKELLDALESTYWSSWQSTAKFTKEQESLRKILMCDLYEDWECTVLFGELFRTHRDG